MIARTWIKLYIEILSDPKMGRLRTHLWRRAVELFLLAGREGNDGALPPVEEMVWILHLSHDKIVEDLHDLAEIGVVHEAEPMKWVVTNFVKRQAASSVGERVRNFRERHRPITNRYRSSNEAGGVVSTSTSSSESGSVSVSDSGEEVQGEGAPHSPVEALAHPDVAVFCSVTGGRVPGAAQYTRVIDAVCYLRKTRGLDDRALAGYLAPFWAAWTERKRLDGRSYDPGNITWLTEWALNGSIPEVGGKQERAEVIRRVARGKG